MDFRKQIEEKVQSNGGEYRGDLTKEVTHLIAKSPSGTKHRYALQWGIRVVALEWLDHSLERGMVLDESLFDLSVDPAERGRGAWVRTVSQILNPNKRRREGPTNAGSVRKLRRTASAKFDSQNDGIWTDIVGGGSAIEKDNKSPLDDSIGGASDSENQRKEIDPKSKPPPAFPGIALREERIVKKTVSKMGIFKGKRFYLQGFDTKKVGMAGRIKTLAKTDREPSWSTTSYLMTQKSSQTELN